MESEIGGTDSEAGWMGPGAVTRMPGERSAAERRLKRGERGKRSRGKGTREWVAPGRTHAIIVMPAFGVFRRVGLITVGFL